MNNSNVEPVEHQHDDGTWHAGSTCDECQENLARIRAEKSRPAPYVAVGALESARYEGDDTRSKSKRAASYDAGARFDRIMSKKKDTSFKKPGDARNFEEAFIRGKQRAEAKYNLYGTDDKSTLVED